MSDNEAWPEWAPKVIAHDFVDDSGDLLPYDFSGLEKQARYNALPEHVKTSLERLTETVDVWAGEGYQTGMIAALTHVLDYLGAL